MNIIILIYNIFNANQYNVLHWILGIATLILIEAAIFWNGIIRVYTSSIQLGIKHRILAAICGWIPIINIIYLGKIIKLTSNELKFELNRIHLDSERINDEINKAKNEEL